MKQMNDIKSLKQEEFAEVFLTNLAITTRVSGIIATGFGKSRLVMLILEQLYQQFDTIYIVVNSTKLKDFSWKEDFVKWNKEYIWKKVVMVTYQTGYKWRVTELDLNKSFIVYDEIDFAIGTPEYSKMIYTFHDVKSLGLTGYVAKSKREELHKLLPIIVEYTFEQAVKDKVVNEVEFVFVKFDLDREKTIKVEWTDKVTKERKSFLQSENDAYDYADKAFRVAWGAYEKAEDDLALGKITQADFNTIKAKKDRAMAARIKLLCNGVASARYAIKLKEHLLKKTDNKVITFSMYTDQANKLSSYVYHNAIAAEIGESNYEKFNLGVIRELAVCGKLDRGVNMVGLNNIILESYTSSDTLVRQRVGRNARLEVHETATFYILLPYYMKKTKDGLTKTQQVTWASNMLKDYDTTNCKIYDQRSIKSDL